MSLLMEALRKAEGRGETPPPSDPAPGPAEDALPDSLLTLDLPEEPAETVAFEPLDPKEETPEPGIAPEPAEAEKGAPEDEEPAAQATESEAACDEVENEPPPAAERPRPQVVSTTEAAPVVATPQPAPKAPAATEPEPAEPKPHPEGDPRLARALLEAGRKPQRHRRRMLLLLVAGLAVVVGLVVWYYLVLLPEGQALHPAMTPPGPSATPAPRPAPASRAEGQAAETPEQEPKETLSEKSTTQTPKAQAKPQDDAPAAGRRGQRPAAETQNAGPVAVKRRPASKAAPTARQIYQQALARQTRSQRPIEIRRSRPARGGQRLRQAWAAYQAGDYQRAGQLYRQVLERHPLNRDALLGLAALAVVARRPDQARDYYLRLLERDPSDPLAVAGLVSVAGGGDLVAAVSRVRSLIADHPDLAPLKFVLGNLYAAQGRWNYAQQAYFEAVAADRDHPDYLYNLAVSLDHLGKGREAARYYRRALDAAGERPAGFDAQAVRRRLVALAGGEGA